MKSYQQDIIQWVTNRGDTMRISLATTRNEKALAQMHVEAARPRFELSRVVKEGAVCLEASVSNAASNPALLTACQRLGMVAVPEKPDRLSIIVTSDDELDAVRDSLKRFFVRE